MCDCRVPASDRSPVHELLRSRRPGRTLWHRGATSMAGNPDSAWVPSTHRRDYRSEDRPRILRFMDVRLRRLCCNLRTRAIDSAKAHPGSVWNGIACRCGLLSDQQPGRMVYASRSRAISLSANARRADNLLRECHPICPRHIPWRYRIHGRLYWCPAVACCFDSEE